MSRLGHCRSVDEPVASQTFAPGQLPPNKFVCWFLKNAYQCMARLSFPPRSNCCSPHSWWRHAGGDFLAREIRFHLSCSARKPPPLGITACRLRFSLKIVVRSPTATSFRVRQGVHRFLTMDVFVGLPACTVFTVYVAALSLYGRIEVATAFTAYTDVLFLKCEGRAVVVLLSRLCPSV